MALQNVYGDNRRGAIVYWQNHRKRLVDAIGTNVIKYDLQPGMIPGNGETTDPFGWSATVTEAGSGTTEFVGSTEAGAVATITTAANENDGGVWQLSGESFELTSDQDVYFGCEFKISDATQSDFLVGLAITDTTVIAGASDDIGFRKVDGSTTVNSLLEKNSSETTDTGYTADTSYHFVEFYWDGSNSDVEFFVDGSSVATPATTNLPGDEALRPTVAFLSGSSGDKTMTIRQLRVIQIGR